MSEVSVRELRNYGGQILDRVEGGESVMVTRDGTPVSVPSPLPAPRFSSVALLEKWNNVPIIDGDRILTLSPDDLPAFPTISAVTLAELSVGPHMTSDAVVQAQRQLVLQVAEASFDPMPFDAACVRRFALVASLLRKDGQESRARAFDSHIAATALAHDLPLYTRNAQDFAGIADLDAHAG